MSPFSRLSFSVISVGKLSGLYIVMNCFVNLDSSNGFCFGCLNFFVEKYFSFCGERWVKVNVNHGMERKNVSIGFVANLNSFCFSSVGIPIALFNVFSLTASPISP